MFGIDGGEFVVLALLALFLLGPERLPGLAKQAARALHDLRRWTARTREDIGRELGPEFENFDLADLNPKNFVKKHLLDPLSDDDAEDDEKQLAPKTYGHPSLSSSLPGDQAGVVSLDKPDRGSPHRTVSLGSALADDGVDEDQLAGSLVALGPDVTTDVFAEPRGLSASLSRSRTALSVPAWEQTSSARSGGGYHGLEQTLQDESAEVSEDLDDEAAAWDAAFYLPPPFDVDAT